MSKFKPIPAGFHSITPYLSVTDADAAIKFYQRVFGAEEVGRITMGGNTVGHAELQIGNS